MIDKLLHLVDDYQSKKKKKSFFKLIFFKKKTKFKKLTGHESSTPEQTSWTSQSPLEDRQTNPLGLRWFDGQNGEEPEQTSTKSLEKKNNKKILLL